MSEYRHRPTKDVTPHGILIILLVCLFNLSFVFAVENNPPQENYPKPPKIKVRKSEELQLERVYIYSSKDWFADHFTVIASDPVTKRDHIPALVNLDSLFVQIRKDGLERTTVKLINYLPHSIKHEQVIILVHNEKYRKAWQKRVDDLRKERENYLKKKPQYRLVLPD